MSKLVPKKRERGANYTAEEKTMFADLVKQYQHIVEDKRTGAIYIGKKKEVWAMITNKYNASCTSGRRETDQLKAMYDNMKQKARKTVGENNKLEYIERMKRGSQMDDDFNQDNYERALKNVREDKKQINKTGGGLYKPKATDSDAKIIAIIQDQVEPLPNPYDSAAIFFKDDMEIAQEISISSDAVVIQDDIEFVDDVTADVAQKENNIKVIQQKNKRQSDADDIEFVDDVTADVAQKENKIKNANITTPVTVRKMKPKKLIQQKVKRNMSAEALKRLYFKKKCENANLERKNIMLDIVHKKKEHALKMVLLKKQIDSSSN